MKVLSNGKLKVIVYDEKKQKAFEMHGFKDTAKPKKKPEAKEDKSEE